MALKATKPGVVVPGKPKVLISGESGVGKTMFSLDFPKPYLIDTEGGATREQYQKKLKGGGGAYFGKEQGSQDFKTVLEEIKELATTKHEFQTLNMDSFSYIYILEAAKAELAMGSDFGKDKKEANKPTRQLIRWLEEIDMNVILICHSKAKWGRKGKEVYQDGTTFDGYDKLEYILDLWIEILKDRRNFLVKKSRISSFQQGQTYPLSYDKFAELYGKQIIERESKPIVMAKKAQVEKIKKLVEVVKIDDTEIEKWFSKASVFEWEEMTEEQIVKCIKFVEKKLKTIEGKGE